MPPAARARGVAASLPHCRQLFGAERLGEFKQVTIQHLIEFIQRQVDAVVGDPILPKIILDTDRFNAATLLHQTLGAACLALAQLHTLMTALPFGPLSTTGSCKREKGSRRVILMCLAMLWFD